MAQIVFISLFLGLVAGVHPVELGAGPEIKSVRITLGSREIATLRQPPWQTLIDFGTGLEPAALTAIGYDANGDEIARTSQMIDLPHAVADLSIVVTYDGGMPAAVQLIGSHLEFARPAAAAIKLDERPLAVENFSARLPQIDWKRSHVIAADMRFEDGTIARRELVLSGGLSYSAGSEITPVLVRSLSRRMPRKLDGCFSADGKALRTGTVERTDALVVMVKDPSDAADVVRQLRLVPISPFDREFIRTLTQLDPDTTARVVWPVPQRFRGEGTTGSAMFAHSQDFDGSKTTVADLLAMTRHPAGNADNAAFADAVAVAGVKAFAEARRRAIVLLVSDTADQSIHPPAAVRKYLTSIGVPLFLWSASGPRPDLAGSWGEVEDVSQREKLSDAIDRLRRTLDGQGIVWLPVDALTALRVKADPKCGVTTVAAAP